MTHHTFPLRTERLSLRPHEAADAVALQRIYAIPTVARFLLDDPWTAATAAENIAERMPKSDIDGPTGALMLVIERDGVAIGDVQLWLTDAERRVAEIGWVLDPAFGGQGLATEAVRAVLELAFAHYSLHRVTAQMDARNLASAKLAGAVGMRREAHFREDWWSKGEWTDTLVFGVLASDQS